MDGVSHVSDLKETVGTFLVPESVRGRDSACGLSRIKVDSINNILVSLGIARELRGELVNGLGDPGTNVEGDAGVEEGQGDEEFLPYEGPEDFDNNTTEFVDHIGFLVSSEANTSDGKAKSGEVLVDNEVGIISRDDELDCSRDGNGDIGEGHN